MWKRVIAALLVVANCTFISAQHQWPKPAHEPLRQPEVFGPGVLSARLRQLLVFSRDGRDMFFVRDFSRLYRLSLPQALRTIK